jgi:N-acetyl-gamma-glutamyl-phosphate reductase
MAKVFIDGQEGTTGLKIHERLVGRTDFELIEIDPLKRKEESARRDCLLAADLAILCLPDDASRQALEFVRDHATRLIDTSTAHRTASGWIYGLPELSAAQRDAIRNARFVANPGCHATGFILGLYPLVVAGILPKDYPIVSQSLTGYSGAGKKLIAKYEGGEWSASREMKPYALGLKHKHIPEMQQITGLDCAPGFTPVVGPFYQGMLVSTLLISRLLLRPMTARDLREVLAAYYDGQPFVRVMPFESEPFLEEGYLSPQACNGTNRAEVFVFGHESQTLVAVRLDNLGKGASGAAIQNLNLMLGNRESEGLVVQDMRGVSRFHPLGNDEL